MLLSLFLLCSRVTLFEHVSTHLCAVAANIPARHFAALVSHTHSHTPSHLTHPHTLTPPPPQECALLRWLLSWEVHCSLLASDVWSHIARYIYNTLNLCVCVPGFWFEFPVCVMVSFLRAPCLVCAAMSFVSAMFHYWQRWYVVAAFALNYFLPLIYVCMCVCSWKLPQRATPFHISLW